MLFLRSLLVTTSKALVTSSDALVPYKYSIQCDFTGSFTQGFLSRFFPNEHLSNVQHLNLRERPQVPVRPQRSRLGFGGEASGSASGKARANAGRLMQIYWNQSQQLDSDYAGLLNMNMRAGQNREKEGVSIFCFDPGHLPVCDPQVPTARLPTWSPLCSVPRRFPAHDWPSLAVATPNAESTDERRTCRRRCFPGPTRTKTVTAVWHDEGEKNGAC